MLVKMIGNNKLILPGSICRKLGISSGDELRASVRGGKIILEPSDPHGSDGRGDGKARILMFGKVSEAFDEEDFS